MLSSAIILSINSIAGLTMRRNYSYTTGTETKILKNITRGRCNALLKVYCMPSGMPRNRFLAVYYSASYSTSSPELENTSKNLDQLIFNLNADIRRIKRVHRLDIQSATLQLSLAGENTNVHGPFVLSCCGSYLPEVSPDLRMEMLEAIWNQIKSPNIECYNALLKSYTSNDFTSFNPFSIIDEVKKANLTPTEDTYYYCLLSFCQRGEIKNAAKILHLIKNSTLSVDERFFNALILGNSRAGDIKSARDVFTIMKSSDLEPSFDSYAALMQAYLERGDQNEIENIYLKAAQEVSFSNDTFLKLLKIAARFSKKQIYSQILNWLNDSEVFYLDVVNTILELVFSGYHEEAFLLLQKSQKALKSFGPSFGSFYIRSLIKSNSELSVVSNMCELMHRKKLNEHAFYIASEACLQQKKFTLALTFFEEMKQKEMELRPHFFLPVIINTFEESGLNGLMTTLQKMTELKVAPDFDILYEWIVPRIFAVVDSPNEVSKLIKQTTDLTLTSGVLSSIVIFLLRQRRVADAAKFTQNIKSSTKQPFLVIEALVIALTKGQRENVMLHWKPTLSLIKFIANNSSREDPADYTGHFVIRLAESLGNDFPELLDTLIEDISKEDLRISEAAFSTLESLLGKQCPLLINSGLVYQLGPAVGNRNIQHPRDMDLEALKCHVQELSSKQMNPRGALRKLFLKYCQMNDKASALKLKKIFEDDYEGLSIGMKAALLGLYTRNDMVIEALQLFEELKTSEELSREGGLDMYKIVDLATLLINSDYIDEGIDLLFNDCKTGCQPKLAKNIIRNVVRLLEAVVSKVNDAESTKKVLEFLLENSIAEPCSPVIGILIKQRIENKNIETAVSEFVYYSQKYKITPAQLQLYYSVLENKDLLAKVFSSCVALRGDVEAKHVLAFAKSDVGNLEGAAETFLKLGNKLKFGKIVKQCQYLSERHEFLKLQNLTKSLQMTGKNYDCSSIYYMALEATKVQGDVRNHQIIIEIMQQQDLQIPSQHLIHYKSYQ